MGSLMCSRINVTKSLLSHHTVVWGYLVFCMFVCTVTDFSVAEKDRGVKFCVRVRLLSRLILSHFGDLWLVGSHGGGIISGMSYIHIAPGKNAYIQIIPEKKTSRRGSLGSWNWPWFGVAAGIGGGGVA